MLVSKQQVSKQQEPKQQVPKRQEQQQEQQQRQEQVLVPEQVQQRLALVLVLLVVWSKRPEQLPTGKRSTMFFS